MDTTNTAIAPDQLFGFDVFDNAGNKIGEVDSVWVDDATNALEFFGVRTGLFSTNHAVPARDAQVGDGQIQVPYGEDQVKGSPQFPADEELSPDDENTIYSYYGLERTTAPSPTGLSTDTTATTTDTATTGTATYGATGTEIPSQPTEAALTESEEELAVGKRTVQRGQVRLRKIVRSERQEVPVELRREEIDIERVPASGDEIPDNAFQEETIEVPVMEEKPVVAKEAHVTGKVQVGKDVESETQTVGGDVRREEVVVEGAEDTGISGRSTTTTGYTTSRSDLTDSDEAGEGPIDELGDKVEGAIGKDL